MRNSPDYGNNHFLRNAGRFDVWHCSDVSNTLIFRLDAANLRLLPAVFPPRPNEGFDVVVHASCNHQRCCQSDQELLNDLVPEQPPHKQRRSNPCNGTRVCVHC